MKPWWWRPSEDPEPRVLGEAGPGKVLVVTLRDSDGDPLEQAWVDGSIASQYDETRWGPSPF